MFTFTFEDQESVDRMAALLQHIYMKDMTEEMLDMSNQLDLLATELGAQCFTHECYEYDNTLGIERELESFGLRFTK
jgi:hypothetical protein